MKKQKGITLIALVVTIILLLILAGVVLNLTLGENGILKKTEQSSKSYKISEILERLEVEKVNLVADKNVQIPTTQEYIDYLIFKGIINTVDIIDIDDNTKNILVEGYLFLVEKEPNGNIKITYQGKADDAPIILKLQVTNTTIDSISIKVIGANATGGDYKYSIKNITTEEISFTEITTITENEYTFNGLVANNDYIIQVELITTKGKDTKETENIKVKVPKVTSITLNKTEINMFIGKKEKIIATVLPQEALDKTVIWTSNNEEVVTVDDKGTIIAVNEGVAVITVTSNEVNEVTTSCKITVIPLPTVEVGATTHIAKKIPYTWEELDSISKVISNNYGTTIGKINSNTTEILVNINGKSESVGIGDYATVNGKQVRILGFNHDILANTNAYGGVNTYAGISFEFVDILSSGNIHNSRTSPKGWGACNLRSTLNNTTYKGLENKDYIKVVSKRYISTYNKSSSVTIANDYLWLLSCSEIWNNGRNSQPYGYAIAKEGEQYKNYKNINANSNNANSKLVKGNTSWWLRSPTYDDSNRFCRVFSTGYCSANYCDTSSGVTPGFSI